MKKKLTMKKALAKWEGSKADKANDKKKGIKEGSKADMREDKKGAKRLMKRAAKK